MPSTPITVVAGGEQSARDVKADEAGRAGDQDAHGPSLRL